MSWLVPESFVEVRKLYREPLNEAVLWYLEDEPETELVVGGTLDQAERQWAALEGEANVIHLLSVAAVDQIERLLPRPWNRVGRRVPTVGQMEASLSAYRFEKRVAAMRATVEVLKGSIREGGATADQADIAELERIIDQMVATFYKAHLPLDDDPEFGGAVCKAAVPPPMRGPGGGRTFDEALAPPRSP